MRKVSVFVIFAIEEPVMPIEFNMETGVAFVGEDVDSFDPDAFDWSQRLKRFEADPENSAFRSIDGVLYSKDLKTLVRVPCYYDGELSIPSGVATIGKSACKHCRLSKIVLPDSVVTIETEAFSWCMSLSAAYIGSGVKSIGDNAFTCCYPLEKIDLPKTLKTIGSRAFAGCYCLKSVDLPQGLTKIGTGAFSRSLSNSATLPDGITSIASRTFEGSSLKTIDLPPNLRSIGNSAFKNSSLTAIDFPDGVKTIGIDAFAFCRELKSLTLPPNIETIGEGAFNFCMSLTKINASGDDGPFSVSDGALLGDYGETLLWFPIADPRRRYVVPDGVKKIGARAFSGFQTDLGANLEELVLPDGLEIIGKEAFSYSMRLTDVVLPESVKYIGELAFCDGCVNELVIPDGIEKICRWAFCRCRNLVLRGSEGSYAEEYAEKNKIPFKPL